MISQGIALFHRVCQGEEKNKNAALDPQRGASFEGINRGMKIEESD